MYSFKFSLLRLLIWFTTIYDIACQDRVYFQRGSERSIENNNKIARIPLFGFQISTPDVARFNLKSLPNDFSRFYQPQEYMQINKGNFQKPNFFGREPITDKNYEIVIKKRIKSDDDNKIYYNGNSVVSSTTAKIDTTITSSTTTNYHDYDTSTFDEEIEPRLGGAAVASLLG